MIHNLLDLYRTLTDPDRLKLLLNTLLSGWGPGAGPVPVGQRQTAFRLP